MNKELREYVEDKIKLFGGNLKDAEQGCFSLFGKPEHEKRSPETQGILETLYEVYRIGNKR